MGTTAQAEDMFAANNVLKSIADSIKATSDIIDGLTVILPDLTRSIVVEVDNMTSRQLTRTDRTIFQTGGFGPTLPQGHIVPLRSDAFTFASRFGEGVDGMVTYAIEEVGEFSVAADNPIVGNASVNVFSNATVDGFISIIGSHSGGNHNHARFEVIEKGLQAQSDWRFCRKCHSMFFDGFPGKGLCGAGGGHEASGFVFTLPHSFTASREHFQSDWRFCRKCQSMFFDGFP